MTVAETSREAYQSIKKKLNHNQGIVYRALKAQSRASREQLAEKLDWPINEVTPRVRELIDYGMVTTDGRMVAKSGKSVEALVVRDINDKTLEKLGLDCD